MVKRRTWTEASAGDPERGESPKQRLDRNLEELYASLRVALPGVQVLFAFLLVLPFQQRFAQMSGFEERVYFATLMATAVAGVLLIAPPVRHRMRFRQDDKAYVVFSANRLAIVGLAFLGLAMSGAVLLIGHVLFGTVTAVVATAGIAALLTWFWFGSPLYRGLSD